MAPPSIAPAFWQDRTGFWLLRDRRTDQRIGLIESDRALGIVTINVIAEMDYPVAGRPGREIDRIKVWRIDDLDIDSLARADRPIDRCPVIAGIAQHPADKVAHIVNPHASGGFEPIVGPEQGFCRGVMQEHLMPIVEIHADRAEGILVARILAEHVIGKLKVFRILSERYRNRRKRFGLRFNLIAAIYNFELELKV